VLSEIGIHIEGETSNDFTCLCPYHSNRDTPAMTVSTTKGTFYCFSPQCGQTGNLLKLVSDVASINEFAARRLVAKHAAATAEDFSADLNKAMTVEPMFKPFDTELLNALHDNLMSTEHPEGRAYMNGRRFMDETLEHFRIGYSWKRKTITVPVTSPAGMDVGFIGRRIDAKIFDNSWKLPKSDTLFNINGARAHSTAYVHEASFDAMRTWQAGFPGAVAIAGGNVSERQIYLLNMYFSRIVIMTDFDDKEKHRMPNCRRCMPPRCLGHNPGRDLGNRIAERLKHKEILWATYEPGVVYPGGAKDVGDLTDEQIKQCVQNATPNFIYQQWDLY
jgi:DNA primase